MNYRVLVHKNVQDDIIELSPKIQKHIRKSLEELAKDPFKSRPNADIKKLHGTKGRKDAYRIRVGDYRIIYDVESHFVYVTTIFHRGKDYRGDL